MVAFLVVGTQGLGNSAGAPNDAATDGCTCHGTSPSTNVQIAVNWPTAIQANTTYNLTLTLTGPTPLPFPVGRNRGGFAAEASRGGLLPLDATTQLKGAMITHTADGNDRRTWTFAWMSPAEDLREGDDISLLVAANAVNGDGVANQLDEWAKSATTGKASDNEPSEPTEPNEEEPTEDTPHLGTTIVLFTLVLGAAWRRHLGSRSS